MLKYSETKLVCLKYFNLKEMCIIQHATMLLLVLFATYYLEEYVK